ncbi:hypothetical protein [Chitinophaga sp. HK235]|uniref:hypothetical protein n=1 Tax=Chitinophaga sp. HK235 TaxID=2952571 RepID=UPI001BA6BB16|nr:hypothetical protein [Chitinophaga sp. HK235]
MKHLYLLVFLFFIAISGRAQSVGYVIISASYSCSIEIDGEQKELLELNHPKKYTLVPGDHIIQVTANGKARTKTIAVVEGKSQVVRFDENETASSDAGADTVRRIIICDRDLSLAGELEDNRPEYTTYCLDANDQVELEFSLYNKKGSLNFSLIDYKSNQVLFSQSDFKDCKRTIPISKRGIYIFRLTANNLFNRSAHLRITRIPGSQSPRLFSATPRLVRDTTYSMVMNTKIRVYSTTNLDHSNKTIVPISLPNDTRYWTFWLGVDQQSNDQWINFTKAAAANIGDINPLFAFGLNMLSELPMLRSTATVNYSFTDNANKNVFSAGGVYNHYTFRYGNNICTDYAIVRSVPRELNLCLSNESTLNGHDVYIKVAAFKVSSHFEIP